MSFLLFVLGSVVGSFVNVVALRYDPDKFLLTPSSGGRSHCPACGHILEWYKLIPFISFLIQAGRCRSCKTRISFRYPLIELVSGVLFVFVPYVLGASLHFPGFAWGITQVLWVFAFSLLLLMSLIDFRLKIIPDEVNIALIVLGIVLAPLSRIVYGQTPHSFMGAYAMLLDGPQSLFFNRLFAVGVAILFFAALIIFTRGRGMGMGDLKLVASLAVLFGWPDILLIVFLSFIIGSLYGLVLVVQYRKHLKSHIAFGPFLALAALLVFVWGEAIMQWYFKLIPYV